MAFTDNLQPASFRNVPFQVKDEGAVFGRRLALHEYPKRDKWWTEDMGLRTRRFSVTGFLVGDDVLQQRDRMIAVCEQEGDAILVHPTYGRLTVRLETLRPVFRGDRGRIIELTFDFIESGAREFPSAAIATGDAVTTAAAAADNAAAGDFVTQADVTLKQGAAVVQRAAGTAAIWARLAMTIGNDATNLTHMVANLQGNFGRYVNGKTSGGINSTPQNIAAQATSVNQLILQASASRSAITLAAGNLNGVASGLSL